ncbi:MAG: hypothetical protein Q8N22_00985 [bacterium]|nr:hypothetical protein [bacterium]
MSKKETLGKAMTPEEIMKQAEYTAQKAIKRLQESIDHGFMTYPELIEVLKSHLKKSIDEMIIFRPDNLPFSLKKIGLNKIYKALIEKEKREEKRRN